jgi:hypothetical protein
MGAQRLADGYTRKGVKAMSNADEEVRRDDPSSMGGQQANGSLNVPAGVTVYDMSGEKLGKVAAGIALDDYFRLEKGLLFPQEYYIPKSAIARIEANGVYLNVAKDDIKNRGWDHPPSGSVQALGHNEESQI